MSENGQKRTEKMRRINLIFLMLAVILFIALYTYVMQKNYSRNTLETAVEDNVQRSDAIYQTIYNNLTEEDYTEINTKDDMQTERYQVLQKRLNEVRSMKSARYLYTAKRNAEGTLIYLVDGLEMDAADFAFPGTAIEDEVIPYLESALSGETVYSQKIMNTTWGHIFTACYPVRNPENPEEIIGALCMEVDMESTYKAIEEANRSASKIAAAAAVLAMILLLCGFLLMKKEREKSRVQQKILEETAAAAEAANKAKSAFLFNMSHDIRTPMNAIIGYADLAEQQLKHPEKLREYLNNIRISGQKLLAIINNVLELARIENNETVIEEEVQKAGDGFDSCMVMIQTAVEEKGQKLVITRNVRYPYIYMDMTHMCEVFLNIVSNAIKYTGEGGIIRCTLEQFPHEKKGWCYEEFSVEDNGIGMSEEFQKHIFEAFTRERTSTVSGVDGTGLGMGIVKKLVDMMDGTITVKSRLGEGSRFTVRIPCRIAEKEKETEKETEYHLDPVSVRGRRILLAEDNNLNAEIAMELLSLEGLVIERAADGVKCVEMMEKAPAGYYSLILMDVQMPVMDGYKATRTIRRMEDPEKAKIPIVAMTANAFAEDREKALEVGMDEHIAKPIDMNRLLLIFQKLLGARLQEKSEAGIR